MAIRTWLGTTSAAASNDANWDTVKPVNGDSVSFTGATDNACDWDIAGLSIVDMTTTAAYSATIDVQNDTTITGDLDLDGATVTGTFILTLSGASKTVRGIFPSTGTFAITGTYQTSGGDFTAGAVTVD